jgi:1,4-alpha-glucan branching enzyme
MWSYPGKKLLFMGQEFASWDEWNDARGLDWHLLSDGAGSHAGVQRVIRDLNHFYRETPAMHARDCEPEGFEWMLVDDRDNSVFAWVRWSGGDDPPVAIVTNLTPVPHEKYVLPLPRAGRWAERINTDAKIYGGSGMGNLGAIVATNTPSHGKPASAAITLPPLATLIFSHQP